MIKIILLATSMTLVLAKDLPQNCEDIQSQAVRRLEDVKSGIFKIYLTNIKTYGIEVFCDMDTAGGGWIVIQRRVNDSVDFYNFWDIYANGFGELEGSFWLGLENIASLTAAGNHALRVDLIDNIGGEVYAQYETFHVANSSASYLLRVNNYSGTAGDALEYHDGIKFTTEDRDNDEKPHNNCADLHRGGWWYKSCYRANLNGVYGYMNDVGINWSPHDGINRLGLRRVEMKIRTSRHSNDMEMNL